jgi:hypothetical protein
VLHPPRARRHTHAGGRLEEGRRIEPSGPAADAPSPRPARLSTRQRRPAADGDPDASYAILDPEAGTVVWRRVRYDIATVQGAMRDAGLPASLSARLSVGL